MLKVIGTTMLIVITCYYLGIPIQFVALLLAGYAFLSSH